MKKTKKNKFVLVAGLGISALSCGWSAAESDFGFEEKRVSFKPKIEGAAPTFKRKATDPCSERFGDPCEAKEIDTKRSRLQRSPMDVCVGATPFSIVSPLEKLSLSADEVLGEQVGSLALEFLDGMDFSMAEPEKPTKKHFVPDLVEAEAHPMEDPNPVVKGKGKAKSRIANSSPVPFSGAEGYEEFVDPVSDIYGAPAAPKKHKEDRPRGVPFPSLDASVSEEMAGFFQGKK
ncbi:MAG: hypothetical protein ACK5PQ_02240 [Alphaproteobacteria bacterium]